MTLDRPFVAALVVVLTKATWGVYSAGLARSFNSASCASLAQQSEFFVDIKHHPKSKKNQKWSVFFLIWLPRTAAWSDMLDESADDDVRLLVEHESNRHGSNRQQQAVVRSSLVLLLEPDSMAKSSCSCSSVVYRSPSLLCKWMKTVHSFSF